MSSYVSSTLHTARFGLSVTEPEPCVRFVLLSRVAIATEADGDRPPKNFDVIMASAERSGHLRPAHFLHRRGNQFQLFRHRTGMRLAAQRTCVAVGIGIGSGYLFPTTFPREVRSASSGAGAV